MEPRTLLSISPPQVDLFSASSALFVENQGQWPDPSVRYAFQGPGANVLLTDAGPVFRLFKQDPPAQSDPADPDLPPDPSNLVTQSTKFSARFDGANLVTPIGRQPGETLFNYFVGDETTWRSNVPGYQTVAYPGLYQGIDLLTSGRGDSLKYEFRVAPGADYRQIQVTFDGVDGLSLDADGALHVQTSLGELIDAAPQIYQVADGRQTAVAGGFQLLDADTYAFNVTGSYDPSAELVIDPSLAWSTYVGGNVFNLGWAIAVDSAGNAIVGGQTILGDLHPENAGYTASDYEAFVAEVTSGGSLAWTTYLGGSAAESVAGIALDSAGNVLVSGWTFSTDFAARNNAYHGGSHDVFVAKLTRGGSLLWSSYLGGSDYDAAGTALAVDSAGNALVAGYTRSADFEGRNNSFNGVMDAFFAKVTSGGSLAWATYIGGSGVDHSYGLALDSAGNALLVGDTSSSDFVSANNLNHGDFDAFVAKVTSGGSVAWATYLGGTGEEEGICIAVDSAGDALLGGYTAPGADNLSVDFEGANNTYHGGAYDGFVAKVTTGGSLAWATYLGGGGEDEVYAIAVDATGSVLVTGDTYNDSTGFAGADNLFYGGEYDAVVASVSSDGSLRWATYLGGSGDDFGSGIATDASGNALVVGFTDSPDFAAANNAYHGGYDDLFVAKLVLNGNTPPVAVDDPVATDEDSAIVITVLADNGNGPDHDAENNIDPALTVNLTNPAAGTLVNHHDGTFTFDPDGQFEYLAVGESASVAFDYRIEDVFGETSEATVTITVEGRNDVPAVGGGAATVEVNEGTTATNAGTFADVDLSDQVTIGASVGTISQDDGHSGAWSWSFDATDGPGQSQIVTITADDGHGGAASTTFSLVVVNVAPTPAIGGVPNYGLLPGETVSLTGSATDPSAEDTAAGLGLTWAVTKEGAATSYGGSGPSFAFAPDSPGTYVVSLTATDKDGGAATVDSENIVVIRPSDIQGMVWQDFNNDGAVNFGEKTIENVVLTLTGTDDLGNPVSRTALTDSEGIYMFIDLRPSDVHGYTITERQPGGFLDGKDTPGTVNGVPMGESPANDVLSGIVLAGPGSVGENYNFGERPPADGTVTSGQTATIGFWQNKDGQKLLTALNGGGSTQLGDWLAATFPNMYANLAGAKDGAVAHFYTDVFLRTKKDAVKLGLTGPVKMDAQALALAFAWYATNETLAGTTAAAYGFLVTANGVGTSTFNVGTAGQAFGVADGSQVAVLDLLFATNDRSWNGVLYDLDHDGSTDDTVVGLSETLLRTLANDVYSAINESGHM